MSICLLRAWTCAHSLMVRYSAHDEISPISSRVRRRCTYTYIYIIYVHIPIAYRYVPTYIGSYLCLTVIIIDYARPGGICILHLPKGTCAMRLQSAGTKRTHQRVSVRIGKLGIDFLNWTHCACQISRGQKRRTVYFEASSCYRRRLTRFDEASGSAK